MRDVFTLAVALVWAALAAAQSPLTVVVRSETHPSLQNRFEQHPAPWEPRALGEEPPTVAMSLAPAEGRGRVLRAVNTIAGGTVGMTLYHSPAAATEFTRLAFDYRAAPGLKVNLFARVRHQDYEIGLSGPPADAGNTLWLGSLPEFRTDGQWHRLEVPLLALVRRDEPFRSPLALSELVIENRHLDGYLLAGFGGNPAGASLEVDDFYLGRPGPADARLHLEVLDPSAADGFAVAVDQQPDTVPAERVTHPDGAVALTGLAHGTHWVHVRARGTDGSWGPATHHRLDVDARPPSIADVTPADGAAACPRAWRCRLVDDGAGVRPKTIVVGFGDKQLGIESDVVSYQPVEQTLAVDLARLKPDWNDGEAVALTVTAEDENGNAMAKPEAHRFTLKFAADDAPPQRARMLLRTGDGEPRPLPGEGTFENGLDEWTSFGAGGTVLERTTATAAAGEASLRLLCTENASPFTCFVRRTPFDAAQYRIVSFDYKVPERLRVDFLVYCNDEYRRIRFTDRDDGPSIIGEVPNVVADEQWHHAEFNLYDMLRRAFPRAESYVVGKLLITGGPWADDMRRFPGNYAGTEYFIDNFFLVPLVGAGASVVWQGEDVVGIAGADVATAEELAALPEAGRPTKGEVLDLGAVEQGLVYLRAKLFDPAGNRAEPLLARMQIDAKRPEIVEQWPRDGARAAPPNLGLTLTDVGSGIEPASLRLEVAGRTYTIADEQLVYNPDTGNLVWDGRRGERPVVFDDQQKVEIRLTAVSDFAGNTPAELPAWSFTMDHGADKIGPMVEVSSPSHAAFWTEGFEGGGERPAGWDSDTLTPTLGDDGRGGRALLIRPTGERWGTARLFEPPVATARFGYLLFECRIPRGAEVDLVLVARDKDRSPAARAVRITDGNSDVPEIGRIPAAVADGQWHWVFVPLIDLLQGDDQLRQPYYVDAIGFADQGRPGPQTEQPIAIDNLYLFRPAAAPVATINWQAADETGVAGYSYLYDDQPDTEPPATVKDQATTLRTKDVAEGLTYFHVRARDGAGNWGPVTHYPMFTRPRDYEPKVVVK